MPKTDFTAKENGFRFSNNDITWSWGPIHSKALCGGMAYASLDYYNAGLEIPQTRTVPAEGTPLHKYIYDRQFAAHGNTVPRFGASYVPIIGVLGTEIPQSAETKKLGEYLRAGTPIPVCMVGQGFGHHVVAIGYTERPFAIDIYDPNIPEDDKQIVFRDGHYVNTGSSKQWRGFFVDDGYSAVVPTVLDGETDWRVCFRCRCLFRAGIGDASLCPAGGRHFNHASANYRLANKGHGQHGWRRCRKCACLFYNGNPSDPGLCSDGGFHNPIGSDEYIVAMNAGVGQGNWYWCKKCNGLFFYGGGQYGLCQDGAGHDPSSSGRYFLPF
ncbi:MAG: hypothetical protein RKO24_15885 [Candidatus Competibacter sp.]|nr:hypothetical protein [Candidatus Competibacter sp.]